jgi:quercetin dioxygenase-like cupin family protein
MGPRVFILLIFCSLLSSCSTTHNKNALATAEQRAPVKCMENSPERSGKEGCTILANRPLVRPLTNLYWHIDRFNSLEAAMKAAGPNGVAAEAHGSFWLFTVEAKSENHYGGHHVRSIGPIVLPSADSFMMRVQSSLLLPGSTTPIHTHSGPELFYIVDGRQCIETQEGGGSLKAGDSYVVPGGVVHRGRVVGTTARRAVALIVYDGARPASHDHDNSEPLVPCK